MKCYDMSTSITTLLDNCFSYEKCDFNSCKLKNTKISYFSLDTVISEIGYKNVTQ